MYLRASQTSMVGFLAKIVNGLSPLTIFAKELIPRCFCKEAHP